MTDNGTGYNNTLKAASDALGIRHTKPEPYPGCERPLGIRHLGKVCTTRRAEQFELS